MTRRITRAKSRIQQAGIPYRVPAGAALAERVPGVLAVLYLLFTSGYAEPADAPGGAADFAGEAVRLARLLVTLLPGEPEPAAQLALFLFQHSRRDARRDAAGNLVTLDRQDRTRWDRAAVAEGVSLLDGLPVTGPYGLQARIAACHATASSGAATDWPSIARWYDELIRVQPTPVVAVNRAVAHGFAHGPRAGLRLLAEIGPVGNYPAAIAAEAELTRRAGDPARAAALFRRAAEDATGAEHRALLRRATEIEPGQGRA
jgi:RNA polymerase sigma-70 factor (ECF subfamily)